MFGSSSTKTFRDLTYQFLQRLLKLSDQQVSSDDIDYIIAKRTDKGEASCLVKLKGLSVTHSIWVKQSNISLNKIQDYYKTNMAGFYQNDTLSMIQDQILVPIMILKVVSADEVASLRKEVQQLQEQSPFIDDFMTDVDQRIHDLQLNKHQSTYDQFKQKYPQYYDKYAICMWNNTSITFEHCYQVYNFEELLNVQKIKQKYYIYNQIEEKKIENLLFNSEKMISIQKTRLAALLALQGLQNDLKVCLQTQNYNYFASEILSQQITTLVTNQTPKFEKFICQNFNVQCLISQNSFNSETLQYFKPDIQILYEKQTQYPVQTNVKHTILIIDDINPLLNIQQLLQTTYQDAHYLVNQEFAQLQPQENELYQLLLPFRNTSTQLSSQSSQQAQPQQYTKQSHKYQSQRHQSTTNQQSNQQSDIPRNILIINNPLTFTQLLRQKLYIDSNPIIYRIINDATKGNLTKQTVNRQLKQFCTSQYTSSIQSLCGGLAATLFVQNPTQTEKNWDLQNEVKNQIFSLLQSFERLKIQKLTVVVPDLFESTFLNFMQQVIQQNNFTLNDKIEIKKNFEKFQKFSATFQIKIFSETEIHHFLSEKSAFELLSEFVFFPLFSYKMTEIEIAEFFTSHGQEAKIVINSFEKSILSHYQNYKMKFGYKIALESQFDDKKEEISNQTTDTEMNAGDISKNNFNTLFPRNQYLDLVLQEAWGDILQVKNTFIQRNNKVDISSQKCKEQVQLNYTAPIYYYQFDDKKQLIGLSANQYMTSVKDQQSAKDNEKICQEFYQNLQKNLIIPQSETTNYQCKLAKATLQGKNVEYLESNNFYKNSDNNKYCITQKCVKGNIIPLQPVSICSECGAVNKQTTESYHSVCSLCENKLNQSLDSSFRQLYQLNDITTFDETSIIKQDKATYLADYFCHQYFNRIGSGYSDNTIQFFRKEYNNFKDEIECLMNILQEPFFNQDICKTLAAASSIVWRTSPLFYRAQKEKQYQFSGLLQTIYTDTLNILLNKPTQLPEEIIFDHVQNYYQSCQSQTDFNFNQYAQQNPVSFHHNDVYQQALKQYWLELLQNATQQHFVVNDYKIADSALALADFDIKLPYKMQIKDQLDQNTKFKLLRIERYQLKNISFCNSLYGILSKDTNKQFINQILTYDKQKQHDIINYLLGVQYPTTMIQYGNFQHLQQIYEILSNQDIPDLTQKQFSTKKMIQLTFKNQKSSNTKGRYPPTIYQQPTPQPKPSQPKPQRKINFIDYILQSLQPSQKQKFIDKVLAQEKQGTYFQSKNLAYIPEIQICSINKPEDFVETVFQIKFNHNEINELTSKNLVLDIFKYQKACTKLQTQPIKLPQRDDLLKLVENEIQYNEIPKNVAQEFIIRKYLSQSVDSSYQHFIYWKQSAYNPKELLQHSSPQQLKPLLQILLQQGIHAGVTPMVVFSSQEYRQLDIEQYKLIQAILSQLSGIMNGSGNNTQSSQSQVVGSSTGSSTSSSISALPHPLKQTLEQIAQESNTTSLSLITTIIEVSTQMRLTTSITNETDFSIFATKLYKLSQGRKTDDLIEIGKQLSFYQQLQTLQPKDDNNLRQKNANLCQIDKYFVNANKIKINELVYPVSSFLILNNETYNVWNVAAFAKVIYLAMFGRSQQNLKEVVQQALNEIYKGDKSNRSDKSNKIERQVNVDDVLSFINELYNQIGHIYSKVCDYLYLTINKEKWQREIYQQWLNGEDVINKQYDNRKIVIQRKIRLFDSLNTTTIADIQNSQMFSILTQWNNQQGQQMQKMNYEQILQYYKNYCTDNPQRIKYCTRKLVELMIKQQIKSDFLPQTKATKEFIKQRNISIQQQLLIQYKQLSNQQNKKFTILSQQPQQTTQQTQQIQLNNTVIPIKLTQKQEEQIQKLSEQLFSQQYQQFIQNLVPIFGEKIKKIERQQLAKELFTVLRYNKSQGYLYVKLISFLSLKPDYKLEQKQEECDQILQQLSKISGIKQEKLIANNRLQKGFEEMLSSENFRKQNNKLFIQLFKVLIDISYYTTYYTKLDTIDKEFNNEQKAQLHNDIQNIQLLTKFFLDQIKDQIEYIIKLHLSSYIFFSGTGSFE